MMTAIWLWILGPIWEVRDVNCKSGKDLPGEKKFRGSYWQARKFFKKYEPKPGHMVRLQATIRTSWKAKEPEVDVGIDITPDYSRAVISPVAPPDVPHETSEGGFSKELHDKIRNPDHPDYVGDPEPWIPEHDCDASGSLVWDDYGACYVPTCSVCGKMN